MNTVRIYLLLFLATGIAFAQPPHGIPTMPTIPSLMPSTIPSVPQTRSVQRVPEGVQFKCPTSENGGATVVAGYRGVQADFVKWGCEASRANTEENKTLTMCGLKTDYRVYQGHFLYKTGNSIFSCSYNSASPATGYDFAFRTEKEPETPGAQGRVFYCHVAPGLRELLAQGPNGFVTFKSTEQGETLEAQLKRENVNGWMSCRRDAASGDFTYSGACNTKDVRFSCSGVNQDLTARCDASVGGCNINANYDRGNWSAGAGMSDNTSYFVCSGAGRLGHLQSFGATAFFPVRRAMCGVGVQYTPGENVGVGMSLLTPSGGNAFLNYGPSPFLTPGNTDKAAPGNLLNFGVQLKY